MPEAVQDARSAVAPSVPAEVNVEQRLRRALAASEQLHEISTQLLQQDDPEAIYEQILHAAVAIMESDFASIQKLDVGTGELELLASIGFTENAKRQWQRVLPGEATTCGMALESGERVIAADIEEADYMAGTPDLAAYRETGIRAVQSTPLVSRGGHMLGMISTHWHEVYEPRDDELRLLDVLARQAADVIERREAEVALRNSEAQLQRALARAQQAAREKDELIGLISHEFRNPLVTILGNVGVLHRRADLDDETRELLLQDLERDGMRLRNLIENMLVLTKADYSRAALEPVLLQRVLPGIVRQEQALDPSRDFELEIPEGLPPALASPAYLGQVVENLITNSRKYSDPQQSIEVRVSCDRGITVAVLDRGRIYDDDEVARFFEPFFRDPRTAGRAGGLGLGMSVCARLVELQDGELTVRPRPGGGIEAAFTLQVAE